MKQNVLSCITIW